VGPSAANAVKPVGVEPPRRGRRETGHDRLDAVSHLAAEPENEGGGGGGATQVTVTGKGLVDSSKQAEAPQVAWVGRWLTRLRTSRRSKRWLLGGTSQTSIHSRYSCIASSPCTHCRHRAEPEHHTPLASVAVDAKLRSNADAAPATASRK
jgi:hypothetical protein